MSNQTPVPLGLKKSFGFGDRLGLAGPGHIDALRRSDFAGIFAQQSIREMTRTARTPDEVMRAAQQAVAAEKYDRPWGADGDHLKTPTDVEATAAVGFCFFTIDPSTFVENRADAMAEAELNAAVVAMVSDGVLPADWESNYLGKSFEVGAGSALRFDREKLLRAAVKYGRAIAHAEVMARHIAKTCGAKPCEIEVSVDETDSPTSALEHLFFALELRRRNIKVVSLAPRFVGEFEKGIDYKGDLKRFEACLVEHVAIARAMGPYKISIHSGSDKFSIYPIIGRVCGELLHVKTAGTSYLEAIRAVLRIDPKLFREIAAYAAGRFAEDRASYHISATEAQVGELARTAEKDLESAYLDTVAGRQLLHVTFGSVLTKGRGANGGSFCEAILELLNRHATLHRQLIAAHLGRHIELLNAG